jgi:hypothetical protein
MAYNIAIVGNDRYKAALLEHSIRNRTELPLDVRRLSSMNYQTFRDGKAALFIPVGLICLVDIKEVFAICGGCHNDVACLQPYNIIYVRGPNHQNQREIDSRLQLFVNTYDTDQNTLRLCEMEQQSFIESPLCDL